MTGTPSQQIPSYCRLHHTTPHRTTPHRTVPYHQMFDVSVSFHCVIPPPSLAFKRSGLVVATYPPDPPPPHTHTPPSSVGAGFGASGLLYVVGGSSSHDRELRSVWSGLLDRYMRTLPHTHTHTQFRVRASLHAMCTRTHPLRPEAMGFVSFGILLVRVRVTLRGAEAQGYVLLLCLRARKTWTWRPAPR